MILNKKTKDMKPEQMLESYLLSHPEYWEYENEIKEVERLRSLVQKEKDLKEYLALKSKQPDTQPAYL